MFVAHVGVPQLLGLLDGELQGSFGPRSKIDLLYRCVRPVQLIALDGIVGLCPRKPKVQTKFPENPGHHAFPLRQQPQQKMLRTKLVSLASTHGGLCDLYGLPHILRKLVELHLPHNLSMDPSSASEGYHRANAKTPLSGSPTECQM